MEYEGDPIAFTETGYREAEESTGYAGDELVDKQWAVAGVNTASAERLDNENKTLRIHVDMTLAPKGYEKDAVTPGRRVWHDLWIGKKKGGQQMLDAFLLHAGVGMPTSRFSDEPTHAGDNRPVIGEQRQEEVAGAIAKALEKKVLVIHVGLETGRVEKDASGNVTRRFNDRNAIDGHHRLTDENVEAIRAARYADGAVVKKTRKSVDGGTQTFLAVKPSAAEGAAKASRQGPGPGAPPATNPGAPGRIEA